MKPKPKMPKRKTWSKPQMGYRAVLDGENLVVIAQDLAALRAIHARLFPSLKFNPKLCHPAKYRRIA